MNRMNESLVRFAVLGLVLSFCAMSPVFGQSAEELALIEKQLAEQKEVAAKLEKKEQATEDEIESLREKLITATSSLQDKQNEQEELETRLSDLEKEVTLREAVLKQARERLATLAGAFLQLNREPPALFLMREKSTSDHIHRTVLLRSLLPRLEEETAKLAGEIENYETLRRQTESQKRLVSAAQQNLQWQKHNLDQMVRSRQGLLKKTSAEKETMARQLESLASEAKDLRQLMERVSQPSWNKTAAKPLPAVRPAALRAGLKMPANGKLLRAFGSKDDFGVVSQGVTILAAAGSPVVAPQSGKVVFAGPFRGYGQIVILQHPGGYHSFLAGFARIDADIGQNVGAGEPLGVLSPQGKPEIYFEWRKGNDPVDPMGGKK